MAQPFIQRSQAETKCSFSGRSPKWRRTTASGRAMILHRLLSVWSPAMKQSPRYLAKYNAMQRNATLYEFVIVVIIIIIVVVIIVT